MYLGHKENSNNPPTPNLVSLVEMWPAVFCTVGGSLIVLAGVITVAVRFRSDWRLVLPAAITVLPILVLFLAWFGGFHYFYFSRYLIFVAPAGAVLLGLLAAKIRSLTAVVAVVLLFAAAVSFDQYRIHQTFAHFWYNYPFLSVPPTAYKAAANFVAQHYERGDEATFSERTDFAVGINYYLPHSIQLNDILVAKTSWQLNAEFPIYCADFDTCVAAGPRRVWLFASTGNPEFTANAQADEAALATKYHEVLSHQVTGIDVILMARNP